MKTTKFKFKCLYQGITELVESARDIYEFYSTQTETKSLPPQIQQVRAKHGITTVRPEFQVDYDDE